MTNIYKIPAGYIWDGEPLMYMVDGGVDWEVRGGQPVMDAGLVNWALISLFTRSGWWGNHIIGGDYQLGDSNFDEYINGPVTRTAMMEAEKESGRALELMVKKRVASEVRTEMTVIDGSNMQFKVEVHGPSGTLEELLFQKYGTNWVRQATDPAQERLSDEYRGNIIK